MTREEFVKWVKTSSGFENESSLGLRDSYWRRELDYADLIYDYLEIEENKVVYKWDEMYWGGSDFRSRTFEFSDFVAAFETDDISAIR